MKLQRLFFAAVGAMALAACSSADEDVAAGERTPISLSYSTLAAVETRAAGGAESALTRAGASQTLNDANIAEGRAVAVNVKPNAGADGGSEGTFTYTAAADGAMTAPDTPPYYPTTGTVKLTAWHPSDAAATFTVQSDQSTDEGFNASDLMFSNNLSAVSKTREAVNLEFEHKMAKLVVNITAGAGVSTIQTVTVRGVKPTVSFNSATGAVGAASGDATDITLFTNGEASTASGAVVFPGQELSGALLDIVTDKGTATYALAAKKYYVEGRRYTLNLTVNLTAVGATNTIDTWTNASDLVIGDITGGPFTYNGTAFEPTPEVSYDGTVLTKGTDYDFIYYDNVNAGTAIILVVGKGSYEGEAVAKTFAIGKATPVVTAPTALTTLTYNGSPQAMVNAGSTDGGELQYSLDDASYSTSIPTGTNAGSYTVYYKVVGGDNYEDVAAQTVNVTIAKAAGSISYATTSMTKLTSDAAFTNGLTKTGDGTVTYGSSDTSVATVAADGKVALKAVGETTITATVADGTNYKYDTKTASYTLTVIDYYMASSATPSDKGKLICTDGHIHAYGEDAACTKDRVAYIAYVGSAGSVETGNSTYKGLAIAMKDANNGSRVAWKSSDDGTCVSQNSSVATVREYKDGIASTNTLTSSDHSSHGHTAATVAKSNNGTTIPTGCSGWFLPSLGQWQLIVQGISGESAVLTQYSHSTYRDPAVNAVITPKGVTEFQSDFYWSTTEYNYQGAWFMDFNGGYADYRRKTATYYVRSVLAF